MAKIEARIGPTQGVHPKAKKKPIKKEVKKLAPCCLKSTLFSLNRNGMGRIPAR